MLYCIDSNPVVRFTALIFPGDTVVGENPGFLLAFRAAMVHQCRTFGIREKKVSPNTADSRFTGVQKLAASQSERR